MIRPEVDAKGIRDTVRILRSIDKTLVSDMSKKMKSEIKPVGNEISNEVNSVGPPLSGFMYPSYKMWEPVKDRVSVTPGKKRKGWGDLVSIEIFSGSGGKGKGKESAGYAIAELAGWKSSGNTPQGRALIRNLNNRYAGWPKGGRIVYKIFKSKAHDSYVIAKRVLEDWTDDVNKKLRNI